jgi:hypothetical protein
VSEMTDQWNALADWLKYSQTMNASIAHIPEMSKHIANLVEWEQMARALSSPDAGTARERQRLAENMRLHGYAEFGDCLSLKAYEMIIAALSPTGEAGQ